LVREWARAQGIEVKDRGRVPADLVAKFTAATGQQGEEVRPRRDCSVAMSCLVDGRGVR
jgi:hypothetical protein